MFTGIIQEIGKVKKIEKYNAGLNNAGLRLFIDLGKLVQEKLKIGESIALNGSCHTLENLSNSIGQFFSSRETLERTNLRFLQINDHINLELSLTPSTRMGGHFVSGHVDSLSKILSIQSIGDSYEVFFEISDHLSKYVVSKGSVCLNGISLTVVNIEEKSNIFSVAIIPHTWNETNLREMRVGALVNFEADMMAKHIEKQFCYIAKSNLITHLTQNQNLL